MNVTQWLPIFYSDRTFSHLDNTSYVALHYSQNLYFFLVWRLLVPPPFFFLTQISTSTLFTPTNTCWTLVCVPGLCYQETMMRKSRHCSKHIEVTVQRQPQILSTMAVNVIAIKSVIWESSGVVYKEESTIRVCRWCHCWGCSLKVPHSNRGAPFQQKPRSQLSYLLLYLPIKQALPTFCFLPAHSALRSIF